MKRLLESRRYLVGFSTRLTPQLFTDVLVIGSGVAGLSAALAASAECEVLVVSKSALKESCTDRAQGGIAVALAPGDSVQKHASDTMKVGQGLCCPKAVETIVGEGPERIQDLLSCGAVFDTEGADLAFTREGGHSLPRIIHAEGDATGREVERALLARTAREERITTIANTFVIDLLTDDNVCVGAVAWHAGRGIFVIWAQKVILASGGAGQLFRETTNPEVATGDGYALAYRAGVVLTDMEFMQFHPTTLYIAGAARSLISEAVRGEGAVLRDRNGVRFMPEYHPDGDLAPRDVVSRSIVEQMKKTGDTQVYLDLRDIPRERTLARFPSIAGVCADFDIDICRDLVPVRPSAHYCIGGAVVNLHGESSIANLYACGEIGCTGLHGANRLGSNSLLEGLVLGHRAGLRARATIRPDKAMVKIPKLDFVSVRRRSLTVVDVVNALKALMGRDVGIERDATGLGEAHERIEFWSSYIMDNEFDSPGGWQLQNMLTVAKLITLAALERKESRGTHYRRDFPKNHPAWRKHITLGRELPGGTGYLDLDMNAIG